MKQHERKVALKIMENMMNRPSSSVFLTKDIMESQKSQDNSFKPQFCLQEIYDKLNSSSYENISDWIEDIEKVWSQFDTPNAPAYYSELAKESKRYFLKENRSLNMLAKDTWLEEFNRQINKLFNVLSVPSPKVKTIAANIDSSLISEQCDMGISEAEYKSFVTATCLMDSPEEIAEINKILREIQPGIILPDDSSALIDVTQLAYTTINAIKIFVKSRLEERGLPYPE